MEQDIKLTGTGAGIDYSGGMANCNLKTGIHYGVISQNEVLQAWCDESEPYYNPACPICGGDIKEENLFSDSVCPNCNEELTEWDFDCQEPASFFVDTGDLKAECGDSGDIFITHSEYFTYCAFCSPCAPGAGYLMDSVENGVKSYCFGHDWFEDEKAPYPVYSVKTGKLVNP